MDDLKNFAHLELVDNWRELYGKGSWKGIITPHSMSHPAKVNFGLAAKIYDHCFEEGWLQEGSRVIDPFFGIGGFAYHAMLKGVNIIGVELEPKFCRLAGGMDCPGFDKEYWKRYQCRGAKWNSLNICPECGDMLNAEIPLAHWFGKITRAIPSHEAHHYKGNIERWTELGMPGTARLIQGDSRYLVKVLIDNGALGEASGSVSSPPFQGTEPAQDTLFMREHRKTIGADPDAPGGTPGHYGEAEGQLANMPPGNLDASVASPPFTGVSSDGGWQMLGKFAEEGKLTVDQVKGNPKKSYPSWNKDRDTSYGNAEGNLAQMPEGNLDMSIASPPFLAQSGGTNVTCKEGPLADEALLRRHSAGNAATHGYGDQDGNLGNFAEKEGGYDLAISSPAYGDTAQSGGVKNLQERGKGLTQGEPCFGEYGEQKGQLGRMGVDENSLDSAIGSPPFPIETEGGGLNIDKSETCRGVLKDGTLSMGNTSGNLGKMKADDGNLDALISSPPYAEALQTGCDKPRESDRQHRINIGRNPDSPGSFNIHDYGQEPGQLGSLRDNGFQAALGSPPYAEARINGRGDEGSSNLRNPDGTYLRGSEGWEARKAMGDRYGEAEGQLGNMPDVDFPASISSSPFEDVTGNRPSQQILDSVESGELAGLGASCRGDGYGDTPGNIGEESGDDFWGAARMILDNLYLVLRPGARAIWVTKRYVKNKKVENFPVKWARLCEAAGFWVIHWHRAWQVEERETVDIEGNRTTKRVAHKSFFKNLYEAKYPENAIDFEEVICTVRM